MARKIGFSVIHHDEIRHTGSFAELLQEIPYFLGDDGIPPLSVVNDLLESGESNAGMSGMVRWEPTTIDETEFDDLCATLEERGFPVANCPSWVKTQLEWQCWLTELRRGVPAEQLLPLQREYQRLENEIQDSRGKLSVESSRAIMLKQDAIASAIAALCNGDPPCK